MFHNHDKKRKRSIIDAVLLPDDIKDAATQLAAFAKAKSVHEKAIKDLSKTMLCGTTEDELKNKIKLYCRDHRDVEDIHAEDSNVTVKTIVTKSVQSNLTEINVIKAVNQSLVASMNIRKTKQLDMLRESNAVRDDIDASALLDDILKIDQIEVLKQLNVQLEALKTTTERHAISFNIDS